MQLTLEESNLLEALSRYPDLIDDLKALKILENLVKRKRDPLVKTGSYPPAATAKSYIQGNPLDANEFRNKVSPLPDPWDPGMFDPYLITYSSEGKNS